jgi:hypothetical protein
MEEVCCLDLFVSFILLPVEGDGFPTAVEVALSPIGSIGGLFDPI